MNRLALVLIVSAASVSAQPVIDTHGAVNSANYFPYGYHGMGLAQGAMIVIFGRGLGPERLVQVDKFPLATSLEGVSVRITSGSVSVDALPIYVSSRQIGVIVPSRTPIGNANVTVTYNGQTSAPESIAVVRRAFGMFTLNQAGTGPAVAQNFNSQTDQPVNTLVESAHPGQLVTLWGTGLGPVSGDEAAGPQTGDLAGTFAIYVGSKPARITYKGRSGCCVGIDQVVFEVPQGVEGCYVPISVVAGEPNFTSRAVPDEGMQSNTGTIAVTSSGKICQDPLGLSGAELTALQTRNGAAIGAFAFLHDVTLGDVGAGAFVKTDLLSLLRSSGIWGLPAGGCVTIRNPQQALPNPDTGISTRLDAGTLTLTGPRGSTELNRAAGGLYSLDSSMFLPPGDFTLAGSGGRDIGAFQASFSVPQPLTWVFRETASRGTYTWQGGDPNGYVIAGVSSANSVAFEGQLCVEPAAAGAFTAMDADWLGGTLGGGPFGANLGAQWLQAISVRRFSAPGMDNGFILAISGSTRLQ